MFFVETSEQFHIEGLAFISITTRHFRTPYQVVTVSFQPCNFARPPCCYYRLCEIKKYKSGLDSIDKNQ
jgi:hypothetical protein